MRSYSVSPNTIVNFTLRIPERLREEIETAAHKNGRSMNAEMVYRLGQSFRQSDLIDSVRDAIREEMRATRIQPSEWIKEHGSVSGICSDDVGLN